ncbi:MAG: pgl [Segetibacter sp.]|nr:pgl [Segetibacter sp.]
MLRIFKTTNEVLEAAANNFVEKANEAVLKQGRFTVALAGGSSPKGLYELLASATFKSKVDWNKVFFSSVMNATYR